MIADVKDTERVGETPWDLLQEDKARGGGIIEEEIILIRCRVGDLALIGY